ncbi:glucose-6-phosphate isomerase [Legionella beliardensis]|uniref:Glucose-6-phosphate isomerase n=1 Tax=Legionella beliardensis TaxID=91822 RepID=A0A378I1U2_9GAMM|nr:glucose-6-phosphate isomerase [Legionella beliardensis]STX28681.1 glucose-6-phosphate isomerase [Legionella beliardensis]
MKHLTELNSWRALQEHAQKTNARSLSDLNRSSARNKNLYITIPELTIDFTHQQVDDTTLELLFNLANEKNIFEKIESLLSGDKINQSEKRPALHTALRQPNNQPILVDGYNVMNDIIATREEMRCLSNQIRQGKWLGSTGKPITDIVNVGIGGSDLGPRFCINALKEWTLKKLKYHFIPDVDPYSTKSVLNELKPETTLFIISSKSFTTPETLHTLNKIKLWGEFKTFDEKHFIAVTANAIKAKELGFQKILRLWDWIGGRFSICSAINFITVVAVGYECFIELLAGAHSMDKHFQNTEIFNNLPILLALMGIWNNNFLHINTHLILAYARQLEYFIPYVQQLDMESNGKSVNNQGQPINYATGPIVWGGLGNQAQHSYFQLLCQGTHRVTGDFISLDSSREEMINYFCQAKMKVLAYGIHDEADRNNYIPGNIPLNHISLSSFSPFNIGQLIALYEHKIFTQSVIWDINPFDQPGVERAKRQYNCKSIKQVETT